MKIIYRFSFYSCVLEGAKKQSLNYPLSYYLGNTDFDNLLLSLDLSLIPDDYNGNNYDLIFTKDGEFVRAEKDLDVSHKLGGLK